MAKSVHNDVLDAALDHIADNGTRVYLCSALPTTYAEASSDFKLAESSLTVGDGNGDYTIADGSSSGRKVTVAAQTGLTASATGTATHVAVADSVNSKVLCVTELSAPFAVTSGNTVAIPEFAITYTDPT